MGLLEKLKNTFFEEEYIEVEEEEKPIAKKVEPKIKKAEKKVEPTPIVEDIITDEPEPEVPNYSDKELVKKDNNIQYFEEEDFVEEVKPIKQEEKSKLYGSDPEDLYSHLKIEKEDHTPYSNSNAKSGFKPTPVISPIYGILDKNYRKEEVIDKKDKPSSYVSRRNADLDFVRNKAFGTLEEENLLDSFTSDIEKREIEDIYEEIEDETPDSLLVDMTETDTLPSVNKVTIADAEEYFEDLGLEYNIDYKDSRYEKATGRRSNKIVKEEPEEEENIIEEDEEDTNLEDNLFDLIDSMYEEKE